jgi:hypothetical protein
MKNLIALFTLALAPVIPAFAQNSAWDYSAQKDIAGKATEFATTLQTSGEGTNDTLIVRCKTTCEVFLSVGKGIADDQPFVRVKFNEHSPTSYGVGVGRGSDSLFFQNPMAVLKAIKDNGGYMTVEYRPYERTPTMVTFGVWNLPPSILDHVARFEKQQHHRN